MAFQLKLFDREGANALIPHLESLLEELERRQAVFRRFQDEILFDELLDPHSSFEECSHEMEKILAGIEEVILQIQNLGCRLRHAERGWVDFLAKKGEEKIYFCWERGEKEIQFYHPLGGGFFERHPLA